MRLALSAGTMVLKERLLEDLWADEAVVTSANTVQSKVSRLRKALGDPALVVGSPMGYTLAVDASAVDALDVARRADEVTAMRTAGDASAAVDGCSAALALFRGESLFGASDAAWLRPHRAQLDGLRLRLLEDRVGARMDLGATGEVVGELEDLVAAHPLREGLWALLMTALYRAGRQAEALAAYRAIRERLVEELGLEPGPELQRLEQQVLTHDPALDAPAPQPSSGLPTSHRPTSSPPATGGNLPPLSSSLVGREHECAEVVELCSSHRLVTMVGPAGVGKTRLALEVASRLGAADGAWLVRLETARTSEAVGDTIATALGAHDGSEEALVERLRGAEVLIVLDNCEHVVDTVAELIGPLLRAGAGVKVLATSQLPLGVDGERVYNVEPLSFEDAVVLFTQRAREQGQALENADGSSAVAEVCRSLDGLPLAIELAAARTRSLSLPEISRRLDDRFSLLRDPTSRRPERRRTLVAAIAWSYDLLFPDDQRGLWALGCFVGGAPLDGVEQVLAALGVPDDAAVDVVGRLVDRSLVRSERTGDGAMRYWLLDSVRTFALERLHDSGEAAAALGAHAAWVAAAAAEAADTEHGARGHEQPRHVAFARNERANIDAALEWTGDHDPILGLRIAVDFGWVWVLIGDTQGAQRLSAALDRAKDAAPPELRAERSLLLGWLHAAAGDVELGHRTVADAIETLPSSYDEHDRARADFVLAYVLSQEGEFDEALRTLERSRPVLAGCNDTWGEGANWVLTAHVALAAGDPVGAARGCVEATRRLADVGDPWFLVHTEAMLGAIAQAEHRFDDACDHLGRAADSSHGQGFASSEAYHRANLGRAQQQAGHLEPAAATLERALDLARATGDLRVAALARLRYGRVLRARGEHDEALACVRAAQDWYRSSGGGDHARLADCLAAAMDPEAPDAASRLEAVLDDARRSGDPEVEVLALDALALRSAATGDLAGAQTLLDLADAAMPQAQVRVTDDDRIDAIAARLLLG